MTERNLVTPLSIYSSKQHLYNYWEGSVCFSRLCKSKCTHTISIMSIVQLWQFITAVHRRMNVCVDAQIRQRDQWISSDGRERERWRKRRRTQEMREAVRGDFMLHRVRQRVQNKTKLKSSSCNKAVMSRWPKRLFYFNWWQLARN